MFFTYTEGLVNNRPSHKNFIAIEDCEALVLSKEYLPLIFKANPKFETLFSLILTEELKFVLLNEVNRKVLSVEENYLSLENMIPFAMQRIPVKYIARYFGMKKRQALVDCNAGWRENESNSGFFLILIVIFFILLLTYLH